MSITVGYSNRFNSYAEKFETAAGEASVPFLLLVEAFQNQTKHIHIKSGWITNVGEKISPNYRTTSRVLIRETRLLAVPRQCNGKTFRKVISRANRTTERLDAIDASMLAGQPNLAETIARDGGLPIIEFNENTEYFLMKIHDPPWREDKPIYMNKEHHIVGLPEVGEAVDVAIVDGIFMGVCFWPD